MCGIALVVGPNALTRSTTFDAMKGAIAPRGEVTVAGGDDHFGRGSLYLAGLSPAEGQRAQVGALLQDFLKG